MSKIVFFDIDGTLLDHEKSLPASTIKGIEELRKNGVYVGIATGRAPFMFEYLRDQLEIDTFVSFNGQYVVFEGEVIYKNPLKTSKLADIQKQADSNGHPLVFMNEQTMKANVSHHERIEKSLGSIKFPHPEEDRDFYIGHEIYQTLLFCIADEQSEYISDYPGFKFIRWHPFAADILPAGGSKAEGIKLVSDRLGFKMKDVYAFGDGLNDLEMLKTVGTGVAMGNAETEVKNVADVVTKDVSEDGIWHGLKTVKLI